MLALVLSVRATAQAATFTDTIYFSFNSTNVYTATVPNGRIWAIASDPGVISFLTGEDDWIVYAHYVNLPIGSTVTDARIILTLRQNDDEREGTLVALQTGSNTFSTWTIAPIARGSNDYTAQASTSYFTTSTRYYQVGLDVLYGDFAIDKSVLTITYDPPPPAIQVTPSILKFGYVPVGSSKDLTVTVKNAGGGTLTGNTTTTAPFSVVSTANYSLVDGQSQVVTIRYQPTAEGTHTGNVVFTGGGDATVPVSGKTEKTIGFPWLLLLLGE